MILDYLGLAILAVLGGVRLRHTLNGNIWSLTLLIHTMMAVFLMVLHSQPKRRAPLLHRIVAWISALLPLCFQVDAEIPPFSRFASLAGVSIAIWALFSLGRSFDVAPVDRELVQKGPYKFVRHPMYASEIISILAIVLLDLSPMNIIFTVLLIATIVLRIYWEENIISGYKPYVDQVRSRLIPGVW